MDPTVKQTIEGFAIGFRAHKARLGTEHPAFLEAAKVYEELRRAGHGARDMADFFQSAAPLLDAVGNALTALGQVPTPEEGPIGGSDPSAEIGVLASPYRARYAGLDRGRPEGQAAAILCERVFALEKEAVSGVDFLGRLAKEAIPGRLAALEQQAIARDAATASTGLSIPCTEHHYAMLGQTLDEVRTETELELEVNRLVECHSVESEWDILLVHYLMKAIHETTGLLMDRSPTQQQTVENSYRFVCDFFGRDWDGIWRHPRVWDMFCMEYRKTQNAWVSDRNCHTPGEARDFLTQLFGSVMGNRVPATLGQQDPFPLVMWEQPLSLDVVPEIYTRTPRPAMDFSDG